jgi:hypothetical protein
MNIEEHGTWLPYKPDTLPENAPVSTIFVRRASDGVDWYDYVNAGTNFDPDSIKMTVVGPSNIVGAAVFDPTMMFPGSDALVLEVFDVVTDDPQAMFGDKVYDAANQTFTDRPPVGPPPGLQSLLDRLAVLEAKVGGA